MEVISGIISGVLLLLVLVTFPLGLRARRRTLKEIAELGSQLEKRTESLVEKVESLVGEEEVAEPSAEEEYTAKYRDFDIKGGLRGVTFIRARDVATKLRVSDIFLMKTFLTFTKESPPTGREEYLEIRVAKGESTYEDVERTVSKSGGSRYFPTPWRYRLIEKGHAYAK